MEQKLQDFINQYAGVANTGDTPENRGQCVGLVEARGILSRFFGKILVGTQKELRIVFSSSQNHITTRAEGSTIQDGITVLQSYKSFILRVFMIPAETSLLRCFSAYFTMVKHHRFFTSPVLYFPSFCVGSSINRTRPSIVSFISCNDCHKTVLKTISGFLRYIYLRKNMSFKKGLSPRNNFSFCNQLVVTSRTISSSQAVRLVRFLATIKTTYHTDYVIGMRRIFQV